MIRFGAILLVLVVAFVFPADAAAPRPSSFHFQYEDTRIYVPVRIGSGPILWFILDTGASDTIVDASVARSAGLVTSDSHPVSGAGGGSAQQSQTKQLHFSVGGVPLIIAKPAVLDLAGLLGPTSGRAPAGIIGSQFFLEHFVDVDFVHQVITLFPPDVDRSSRYTSSVPLTLDQGLPLTQVQLTLPGGRAVRAKALVDLGAKSTFLIPEPFIERERLRDEFSRTVESALGAGVGGDTYYAFGRALRIGFSNSPLGIDRPVVGLSVRGTLKSAWHDGLLGADFLSRFRLGFDYAHNRLMLTELSRQAAGFDRSGLFIVAKGENLRQIVVKAVIDQSPAARAGLAPGDQIVAIDGTDAAALGLAAVRDRLKRSRPNEVTLIYLREGQRGTANLKLRDLL